METYHVQVERIDVVSGKAFAEVVATLEKNAPIVESSALVHMISSTSQQPSFNNPPSHATAWR
jgi:hypothetical protein